MPGLGDNTRSSLGEDLLRGMPEAAPEDEPTLDQRVEDAYETMREALKVIYKARHTDAYYRLWNALEDMLDARTKVRDAMREIAREGRA